MQGLELWLDNEPLGRPIDLWRATQAVERRGTVTAVVPPNVKVDLTHEMAGFGKRRTDRNKDMLFFATHQEDLDELLAEDDTNYQNRIRHFSLAGACITVKRQFLSLLAPTSTAALLFLAQPVPADEETGTLAHWPQWRGPLATGVAPSAQPPLEWSEDKNVRWKVALPGNGHSTPIVWGDRVFVTAAVPYGKALDPKYSDTPGAHDNLPVTHRHESVVLALDRSNGKVLWQRTVHQGLPHEAGHSTASLASHSPVTDGEHLFAFFGSRGLYALDLDGELKWQKDLGRMRTKHAHGEGSSPALAQDTLVVNWDHEGESFVVAFDKSTGEERWKVARQEVTSWATPIVVPAPGKDGKPQVIVSGTGRVRGYDLATGRVIWECGGLSANIVASPVAGDGMVFAGSSYEKRALLAIRLDGARGDITGTDHVVWTRTRGTPYVPSPLLYDDSLYFLRHYQGILSRVHTLTGEDQGGPFRLNGIRDIYASPVGAHGRVYITDRAGTTLVIGHEAEPRVLALNHLDDSFSASAALVDRELFLRGERHLYCLAEPTSAEPTSAEPTSAEP